MNTKGEYSRLVARRVYTLFLSLTLLRNYIRLPKDSGNLILFIDKNFERSLNDDSAWDDTGIYKDNVDGLIDKVVFILWTYLEFTREINAYLKYAGRAPVNFLQEAMLYDKEQKASQQQRKNTDQKGQD